MKSRSQRVAADWSAGARRQTWTVCSFYERHLVDLSQRGHATQHLLDRGLTQEPHAFVASRFLDLGRRPARQDQLADVVGEVEQFADRDPALESGAAALHAPGAFEE